MFKNKFNLFSKIESLFKGFFLALIYIYRFCLKPLLGSRPVCRFQPSCSEYAAQSFKNLPILKAFQLTAKRLLKCHPFGSYGYDPVPTKHLEKTT